MDISYSVASTLTDGEILYKLKTTLQGLSNVEAEKRYTLLGKNLLDEKKETPLEILVRQLRSPFIYLLFAAVVFSVILGETVDALLILFFIFLNTALGFWQEFRSFKSLEILKKYLVNTTHVRRDGIEQRVDAQNLVPGDIVILRAGDKIPADTRFLDGVSISVDESILTGESAAVTKDGSKLQEEPQEYTGAKNIGFSGTFLTSGKAQGVVIATGYQAQLGKLAKLVVQTRAESPFQQGINKLSTFILRLSLGTILVIIIINFLLKGTQFNIGEFLIFTVALTVGVVPEALPLVITVSLSQGAMHLVKKKVVPKRLSSIEDLGSIDILATDKTGTITENQLTIAEVHSPNPHKTLELAALASTFLGEAKKEPNNAFDIAIWNMFSSQEQEKLKATKRFDEEPFDPIRKVSSVKIRQGQHEVSIIRGAPEEIVEEEGEVQDWIINQGRLGRRVIAVSENNHYEGMISFLDPLKKTAKKAILDAEHLGIQVKILTGDRPEVAGSVAYQIGLIKDPKEVVLGKNLETLPLQQQLEVVKRHHVFARVTPKVKFHIIELLKRENFTVGFLGEGFNDAPALKLAHVSLAVEGASDIAKDASDIILLNKSLHVIVDGIKEGRRTFANTIKYIKLTLTSNFGNFYTLAIASILLPFLPMLPIQILLLNLLTDFPLVSIATDHVDKDDLLQPKGYNIREIAFFATILGIISTIFDFTYIAYFSRFGESTLQTMWFIGSCLTELVIFYSIRTKRWFFQAGLPSLVIIILTLASATIGLLLPFTLVGSQFFRFITPSMYNIGITIALVVVYFAASEFAKIIYYQTLGKRS